MSITSFSEMLGRTENPSLSNVTEIFFDANGQQRPPIKTPRPTGADVVEMFLDYARMGSAIPQHDAMELVSGVQCTQEQLRTILAATQLGERQAKGTYRDDYRAVAAHVQQLLQQAE